MWKKVNSIFTVQEAPTIKAEKPNRKQELLDLIAEDGTLKNEEYAKIMEVSGAYVSTLLTRMEKSKTISVKGRGKSRVITPHATKVYNTSRKATPKKSNRKKRLPNGEPQKRVLRVVSNNEDVPMTYYKLEKLAGISKNTAHKVVEKLEREKAIVSSEPNGSGERKFWLYSSLENGPAPRVEASTDTAAPRKSNDQAILNLLEKLVMEYVQETRSTNVLEFLDWLERLNKLK